jgi:hypothetical protein
LSGLHNRKPQNNGYPDHPRSCLGYYVHDLWHYEHRQPDGSIAVGGKVDKEVTGWFPASAFLRTQNHSSSPKQTIIKLLGEFEDYICNSDLTPPSDSSFWRKTFAPGSFSIIHTSLSKHDEFIHKVWNHYLESEYYPDSPQRVFLCTTDPIDHARYIPSSTEEAQQAYDELLNHSDLQALDTASFLRGWFWVFHHDVNDVGLIFQIGQVAPRPPLSLAPNHQNIPFWAVSQKKPQLDDLGSVIPYNHSARQQIIRTLIHHSL